MNAREISRYFQILSALFKKPCTLLLTGAPAGAFYGRIRATMDIDFAVKRKTPLPQKDKFWQEFSDATHAASRRTGIAAQYAEDIDRWSSITFLDYWKHTHCFKRFGKIEVRTFDPSYWAIGKFTRYLDPDIRDLIQVFKKTKTSWRKLARVLGVALRKSPKSTACFLFRRQVEDFFKAYGKRIWGKRFRQEIAIAAFHAAAGIKIETGVKLKT